MRVSHSVTNRIVSPSDSYDVFLLSCTGIRVQVFYIHRIPLISLPKDSGLRYSHLLSHCIPHFSLLRDLGLSSQSLESSSIHSCYSNLFSHCISLFSLHTELGLSYTIPHFSLTRDSGLSYSNLLRCIPLSPLPRDSGHLLFQVVFK